MLDTPDAGSTADSHSPLCDTSDTQKRPSIPSPSSSPVLFSDTPLPSKPTYHIPRAPDDLDDADFDEILASEALELEYQKGTTVIASEDGPSTAAIDALPSKQTPSISESTTKDQDCSSGELATCDGRAGVEKAIRDTGIYQTSLLAPETPPGGSGDPETAGLCERLQPDYTAMQLESYELLDISEFEEDSDCMDDTTMEENSQKG